MKLCENCKTSTHVGISQNTKSGDFKYLCLYCSCLLKYLKYDIWSVLDNQRYKYEN